MPYNTPIPFKPTGETEKEFKEYLYDMIKSTLDGTKDLRENKIREWRDLTEGKPRDEKRNFPWKNASNLVVQLIGTHVDTLLARIMGSIYELSPIWPVSLMGEWNPEDQGEEQRDAIEQFLNTMAIEPSELDLYRVESVMFDGAIKYGTMFCKEPWEYLVEAEAVGVDEGKGISYSNVIKRDGPRPEVVPLENMLYMPNAPTLEDSEFVAHIVPLRKYDLLDRKRKKVYPADLVDKILQQPDRNSPTQTQKDNVANVGIQFTEMPVNAEWDIYECHFPWSIKVDDEWKRIRVIVSYHYKTKTLLRAYHCFYPDNDSIFDMARLGYTDKGLLGYGFAEMLKHYQEEVSGSHNRKADNETLSNTSILRIDPSRLADAQFSIYPMAILPFAANEVEVLNLGRTGGFDANLENQVLGLAKERAGIDPGVGGSGSGVTNPKKGIYSAMGTFSVLQAGNRRTNLRISDMRYTHIRLGRKFLNQYANFGIGAKIQQFGKQGEYLTKALANYKQKRIALAIRAATASINREVEKQTDMMMIGIMRQHYMMIGNLLQNLPQAPPHVMDYLVKTIIGSDYLMKHILQNFGYDDVSRLLPEPAIIKELKENAGRNQQAATTTGNGENAVQANAGQPAVQDTIPTSGGGGVPVPSGSV